MDTILRYKSISVFSRVATEIMPLAMLTVAKTQEEKLSLAAEVFRRVADSGTDSTGEWIKSLMLTDEIGRASCRERV